MLHTDFDVNKVFQERLANSLGLDKYKIIMTSVRNTDISFDVKFQKTFNGFYLVRRNESWRKTYYDFFEKEKNATPTFESIITFLYENTGNVEPSFSSKMLATIDDNNPIWDKYVLQNLNIEHTGTNQEEKLINAIKLYAKITEWYHEFLLTDKAKECVTIFDSTLPDYKWISNVKKIDTVLWSIR